MPSLKKLGVQFFWTLLLFTIPLSADLFKTQKDHQLAQDLNDMRIEIGDLKHALNAAQTEISILEEKIILQPKTDNKASELKEQFASLQRKVSALEKNQEKILADIKQLIAHSTQINSTLTQYRDKMTDMEQQLSTQNHRLDEVNKLKGTLSSISKAMRAPASETRTHKVKAGETLEKIARKENTTVEELKRINGLQNDRIVVGQTIQLP